MFDMTRKIRLKSTITSKFRNTAAFISIGITSCCVIILFSITSTVKQETLQNIENMGAYVLRLYTAILNEDDKPPIGNLVYEDLLYLKKRCPSIKRIAMLSHGTRGGSSQKVVIEGKKKYFIEPPQGLILGTLPDYRKIKGLQLIQGRFINELDIRLKRRVCVVGNTVYSLLGKKDIIGKKLIGADPPLLDYPVEDRVIMLTEPLTVIGVLARENPLTLPVFSFDFWFDANGSVFIPYSIMKEVLEPGMLKECFLREILVQINKDTYADTDNKKIQGLGKWSDVHPQVQKEALEIINALKERYGKEKIFYIFSEKRLLDKLEEQSHQANIFTGIIGIVSLIASIISILSIMLISITNRTTEIGIRRAIGARKRDISLQFLKETAIVTGKGGIGGIILGLVVVYLLGKYTGWEMVVPIYSLFFSIAAIGIIAIISGIYPAMKAASIPPAIAVKYE